MASAGSITPETGEKITDETWQLVLESSKHFATIKSASITNPGTGDKVKMTSPENKLAEFTFDGKRQGVIWLPVHTFELGFEGEGDQFMSALNAAAKIVGGDVTLY